METKPVPITDDIPTHPPEHGEEVLVPETHEEVLVPESDEPLGHRPVPKPVPRPAPTPAPPVPPSGPVLNERVDKEKMLGFLEDIIDTLTFKRVLLIGLLTVIALVLNAVFENRKAIVDTFVQPKTVAAEETVTGWTLSEGSKKSLQNLALTTNVTFVSITDVDLKKNRRVIKYYYLDDPTIKIDPASLQSLALPNPVFDYDPKNTAQMVAVLSNEFRCDPYRDTLNYRFAPYLAPRIPTVCRLAVPPFVGQFVGFITVGMDREMNREELNTIRLEVSRIAVEIYLNDVIKKPTTAPAAPPAK